MQTQPFVIVVLFSLLAGATFEPPQAASGAGIEIIRDVPYATGPSYQEGRGLLDIYLPAEREDAPVAM